jgi:hypothetical protein
VVFATFVVIRRSAETTKDAKSTKERHLGGHRRRSPFAPRPPVHNSFADGRPIHYLKWHPAEGVEDEARYAIADLERTVDLLRWFTDE